MEVVSHDMNKFIWEVVDDNVVEEVNDHDDIGLRGFSFNCFARTRRG